MIENSTMKDTTTAIVGPYCKSSGFPVLSPTLRGTVAMTTETTPLGPTSEKKDMVLMSMFLLFFLEYSECLCSSHFSYNNVMAPESRYLFF